MNFNSILQALLDSGELQSPIVYLGQTLTASGGTGPVVTNDLWDWDNAHSLTGAPRSFGVDALRAKLFGQGKPVLANLLPEYHVGDFWSDTEFDYTFVSDDDRFVLPADALEEFGLTEQQGKLILGNLMRVNGEYMLFDWQGGGERVKGMYRGKAGDVGFTANDPTYGNGKGRGLPNSSFAQRPGVSHTFRGPDATKHYVYDVYFNTSNAGDVVRYWTSWAKAHGANV
jgi:hypothetical protein